MATINESTKHTIKKKSPLSPATRGSPTKRMGRGNSPKGGKRGAASRRGSAPRLHPETLASSDALELLLNKSPDEQQQHVQHLFQKCLGASSGTSVLELERPHVAALTTRDRAAAAADVAMAAKHLGMAFVLGRQGCGLLDGMQLQLFPQGVHVHLTTPPIDGITMTGLKPSASAVSLSSMVSSADESVTMGTDITLGTDSKRGKTTPAAAREGCLLILRALCETTPVTAEPYVVGAFLAAALDECASASSSVRQASQDTAEAIVAIANPWTFSSITCPLLLQALLTTKEWRVKVCALERLSQCTERAPKQVHKWLPTLIPALTQQTVLWDTKPQVSQQARRTISDLCVRANTNPDVAPAIPAVVQAICKPAETNKAVSELMGTTFVVPVDAPTLSILCPLLSRALKEKLAIHKRAACVVISNMSKLVETPQAIQPFESLLVPELQKVSQNVAFEEIRDEALKALQNLTKALGSFYEATADAEHKQEMEAEKSKIEAEQERIDQERQEAAKREEALNKKEEEERKKFKEAMDAQRELDRLTKKEAEEMKKAQEMEREKQKLSTKGKTGKCQACGLKKCKKTCMFYSDK